MFFDNQPSINFTPLLPVTVAAGVDQCAGFTEAIAIGYKKRLFCRDIILDVGVETAQSE